MKLAAVEPLSNISLHNLGFSILFIKRTNINLHLNYIHKTELTAAAEKEIMKESEFSEHFPQKSDFDEVLGSELWD